ncbi:unnamed protein product [Effrenium voratum]|nr:unnamed protein product [Effrenium voratum]
MREAGVPPELRPDQVQLKNMRPKQGATRSGKSIACLGALRAFVSNPPKDVHCVCEDDRALIAFSLKELIDERMQGSNLECFLLDWTFKTNSHGLLLGSVGPVGLVMQKHGPGMRFLPTIFVLANSEDELSQHLAAQLYLDAAKSWGIKISYGFFACSCYTGVHEPAYMHCELAEKDATKCCLAPTTKGARHLAESRSLVSKRLAAWGYERLDTAAEGNCFFIALAFSAELPLGHDALPAEVCNYLRTFPREFGPWFDTHWTTYNEYLRNLSRDGVYAWLQPISFFGP